MQIVEICEPNANTNTIKEIAVGIDFGTTNSLIAFSSDQNVVVIGDIHGQELIPSNVIYSDINISSIKRLFGKSFEEIKSSPALLNITSGTLIEVDGSMRLNIDSKLLSIVEIASTIFIKLKNMAEQFLKTEIRKAVITVPAYYHDAARGEVILAAKIAGFEILRVLTEPTAAAYAYKLNKQIDGHFLVYDLGGGTFDISVLNMNQGVLQVVATGGNNMLGGDDIDLLIADYWSKKYNIKDNHLLSIAKKAKELLSTEENFSYMLDTLTISLDKQTFETLIYSLIKITINLIKDVLSELDETEIKGIILVGGSSRIPLIRKLLNDNFNIEILSDLDPDKIVALGAALQAENLTSRLVDSGDIDTIVVSDEVDTTERRAQPMSNRGATSDEVGNVRSINYMLLIDAVPLSLGLELYGGLVEKIIPRNSPLPFIVKKEYTTYSDNQTAIEFHIVQGEREFANDCRSLGIFELSHLPKAKAGSLKIEVIFAIDLDGVLSVSAIEKTTGKAQMIVLKPTYGLSTEEINIILENSYKNVNIDHQNKLLKETIINAENSIKNINKIISNENFKNLISNPEELYSIIDDMKESIKASNREAIIKNIEKLNKITEPFVLDIINISVKKNLKGKNLNKV